jgi:Clp protease
MGIEPEYPEIPFPLPPERTPPHRTEPVAVPMVSIEGSDAWETLAEQRRILVSGPLDRDAVLELSARLMAFDGASSRDVEIVINSSGGPLAEIFALLDVIGLMRGPDEHDRHRIGRGYRGRGRRVRNREAAGSAQRDALSTHRRSTHDRGNGQRHRERSRRARRAPGPLRRSVGGRDQPRHGADRSRNRTRRVPDCGRSTRPRDRRHRQRQGPQRERHVNPSVMAIRPQQRPVPDSSLTAAVDRCRYT